MLLIITPSIPLIKDKYQEFFYFKFEFTNQILKYINEIGCNKSLEGEIPTKTIKIANEELIVPIKSCINKCISSRNFPNELIVADIIPVYKKQDVDDEK